MDLAVDVTMAATETAKPEYFAKQLRAGDMGNIFDVEPPLRQLQVPSLPGVSTIHPQHASLEDVANRDHRLAPPPKMLKVRKGL